MWLHLKHVVFWTPTRAPNERDRESDVGIVIRDLGLVARVQLSALLPGLGHIACVHVVRRDRIDLVTSPEGKNFPCGLSI